MPETLVGQVPDSWYVTTLGELCRAGGGDIQTGPFGSQLHASDYVPVGIPSVMPQNIGDNVILEDGIARITPEDANRLSRYLLRSGDIVYSRRGDVERRALVRSEQDGWLCGTGCLRVRLGKSADPRYVSYYLGHPEVRQWIVRHAIGATMPNLNTGILSNVPIVVPPTKVQEAIAAVLGALDDKIAVNERIAAAADELIRVRYLHVGQNATDVIKIGELGEQRREVVNVGEFDANDNYIGLEHVPRRHVWLSSWANASGLESSKGRFKEGDILFGKLRPYFHKVGIALVAGVASTDIIVIRPRQEAARGWLLAAASSDDVIDHASAVGDGTRMPRAKWQDIASFEVPWPGNVAAAEFDEFVAVLTERVRASIFESRNLVELRDTLLPGLMSGAIRVRDAEKAVEAVT